MSPEQYGGSLWKWDRCHVQHAGRCHTVPGSGYFIRRYELDQFLLARSGAEVIQHAVQAVEKREGLWIVDEAFMAPSLIGAGGTHCPLARSAFRTPRAGLVAAQEHEFQADGAAVAATRVGLEGEPELLLHDDWGGYSWNVPKGDWLNVGSGTSEPRQVRAAWAAARKFFFDAGHLPADAARALSDARGHSYYLFDPEHLAACEHAGILIAGDALGLAHPLTGEGILPAVVSGRLAADALLAGTSYRAALEQHPLIRDYTLAHALLRVGIALKRRLRTRAELPAPAAAWAAAATARGFARLFSGTAIPGSNIAGAALLRHQASKAENIRP